jgi:hypothetical protein
MKTFLVCVVFASILFVSGCKKSESVQIGGECSERGDCVNREDCVELPSGKKVCTKSCSMPVAFGPPGTPLPPDECPAPSKCQLVNMDVDVPGKTVAVTKIPRCLIPGTIQ